MDSQSKSLILGNEDIDVRGIETEGKRLRGIEREGNRDAERLRNRGLTEPTNTEAKGHRG